ncbi:hypothetical protein [Geoalkalibacter halelectricus]|uniref:Uncharacterized protein n=1 Tax=Geoalkalibacter halelectricus TaxID=2847045 RepID=A0ABY5ZLZ5_9BACT|nr:hypothetical protein [Geoalkalibacter halelectricus]MDO3377196.1 hypothetical protein [Geoalkalibacter halelectricus]UWZ79736.1 hypothetical protein L9S41_18955 [Geoalkalibacter halelectricus]
MQYLPTITKKEAIKGILDQSEEIAGKHAAFTSALESWWQTHLPDLEALPTEKNVFDLYHRFSGTITGSIGALGILDDFKSRGAFAAYWNALYTDLRSVAASGWNAELIPDEEILQSQFPEVLKELRDNEARRDELTALFKEVNDLEEGAWSEDDYEVWPKDELAEVKGAIKEKGGELKELTREVKNRTKQVAALKKAGESTAAVTAELEQLTGQSTVLEKEISAEEARIARHHELEAELKSCKKIIKEIKERKAALVEEARKKIDEVEAKRLILVRWQRTLHGTVAEYLAQYGRDLRTALDWLWDNYHQPLHSILLERDEASLVFTGFLKELGYEY